MRILLVEDETELREALTRHLRGEGHGVDSCADCRKAREASEIVEPDLAILDRILPDGDSIRLVEGWRRAGKSFPVLFLTARDSVPDRVDGLRSGADDYLVKPFAMAELLARISAIARRGSFERPPIMRWGAIEIDTARREVRVSGTLVPLRPKEFTLLELLASRPGRIVSRQKIIEACWDEAHEPMSNVEETLVAALRRKLGDPRLIRTIRGAGYLLEREADAEPAR